MQPHERAAKFYYEHLLGNARTPGLMQNHEGKLREFGEFYQLILKPKSKLHLASITPEDEEDHKKMLEEAKGFAENDGINGWDHHTVYDKKLKTWWITFGPEEAIRKLKEEEDARRRPGPQPDSGQEEQEEPESEIPPDAPEEPENEIPPDARKSYAESRVRPAIVEDGLPHEQAAKDVFKQLQGLVPRHYKIEVEHGTGENQVSQLRIKPKWWAFLVAGKYEREEIEKILKEKISSAGTRGFGRHVPEEEVHVNKGGIEHEPGTWSSHIEPDDKKGWTVVFGELEKIRELKERELAMQPVSRMRAQPEARRNDLPHQALANYYYKQLKSSYGRRVSIKHLEDGPSQITLKFGSVFRKYDKDDVNGELRSISHGANFAIGERFVNVTSRYHVKERKLRITFE